MSYGEYNDFVMGPDPDAKEEIGLVIASIQWAKNKMSSAFARVTSKIEESRKQRQVMAIPVSNPDEVKPSSEPTIQYFGISADLREDFENHLRADAHTPKPEYGGFQGSNPESIWANMGPKPANE